MKSLLLFFVCLCFAARADWYVATNGNDTTGDGSLGNPWRTIRHGLVNMTAGQPLNLRGGLYDYETRQIEEVKSGTGVSTPTIVQSYTNEIAIIRARSTNNTGGTISHGFVVDGRTNVVLNGFFVDGTNCTIGGTANIKFTGTAKNWVVTNVTSFGSGVGQGMHMMGENEGDLMNGLVTHCRFITNGWGGPFDVEGNNPGLHQIYLQASGVTVENCYFDGATNTQGQTVGINYFGGDCTNGVFRNNFFTNCGFGVLASASRGSNCWIYNNAFTHCVTFSIKSDQMRNVYIWNNTIWSNVAGIHITRSTNIVAENNIVTHGVVRGFLVDGNSDGVALNNNLAYTNTFLNPASQFADFKLDTAWNVTTNANRFNIIEINGSKTTDFTTTYDAKFVFPATNNFRVLAGSSAIGNGKAQSVFNTDFGGNLRSLPWTIGAWQFLPANSVNIITARIGTGIILGP